MINFKFYSLTNNSLTFEFKNNKTLELIFKIPVFSISKNGIILEFNNKFECTKFKNLITLDILNKNTIDYFISLMILGFGIELNIEIEK